MDASGQPSPSLKPQRLLNDLQSTDRWVKATLRNILTFRELMDCDDHRDTECKEPHTFPFTWFNRLLLSDDLLLLTYLQTFLHDSLDFQSFNGFSTNSHKFLCFIKTRINVVFTFWNAHLLSYFCLSKTLTHFQRHH